MEEKHRDTAENPLSQLTARERVFASLAVILTVLGTILQTIPGIRFSGQFTLGLAFLCAVWLGLGQWAKTSGRGQRIRQIFRLGVLVCAVLFAGLETAVILGGAEDPDTPAEAVIVLGAGVNGITPSLTLQCRIDRAEQYLRDHPDIPAVLSGGQGSGEAVTEAEAMRKALTARGIPEGRLLLEESSTSTAENLYYSVALLREMGYTVEGRRVAVITNRFHLCRAKLLLNRRAIGGGAAAVGVSASLPWWLSGNYYLREAFALGKTLLADYAVPVGNGR